MIKYERAWNKLHPNMVGMAVEKTEKDFIHFLLQKQIDEDNKRFLGYIGEDEKPISSIITPKISMDFTRLGAKEKVVAGVPMKHITPLIEEQIVRNELRAELRDKVNKR